jgi:hypothetical protein
VLTGSGRRTRKAVIRYQKGLRRCEYIFWSRNGMLDDFRCGPRSVAVPNGGHIDAIGSRLVEHHAGSLFIPDALAIPVCQPSNRGAVVRQLPRRISDLFNLPNPSDLLALRIEFV